MFMSELRMAKGTQKKATKGPYPDMGDRIRRIRMLWGGPKHGDAKPFAEKLGFPSGDWSRWENGHSITWPKAVRLLDRLAKLEMCDSLTLDWIYRGRLGAIPPDLLKDLARVGDLP